MKQSLKDNWYIYLILAITVFTRYFFIGLRPPHFDEGINGFFVDQMWSNGFFNYDPNNYHGPLHFYFLQLFEILFGRSVESFRYVTATVSLLTVGLIIIHKKYLGRAAIWAALIVALSPGAMYYSRYAIHEIWIPFSLILFSYGILGWFDKKDLKSQVYIYAAIAIAFLNKETAGIHFFAFVVALIYLLTFHKKEFNKTTLPPLEDIFVGLTWVLISILVVYSAFGLQVEEVSDFFKGFLPWLQTGTQGNGHQKPASYWLKIAWDYELWVLIAILCSVWYFAKKKPWFNFFAINAVVTLIIYSLIPYKTPWCFISIFTYFPFILGLSIESIDKKYYKYVVGCFGFLILFQSYKLIKLNYYNYADKGELYVYVHSTNDYFKIINPLKKLVADHPHYQNMRVTYQLTSPWPITWELANYTNVSYRFENENFDNMPFILIDEASKGKLEPNLKKTYLRQKLTFRNHMSDVYVYFQKDIFEKYVNEGELVGPAP